MYPENTERETGEPEAGPDNPTNHGEYTDIILVLIILSEKILHSNY